MNKFPLKDNSVEELTQKVDQALDKIDTKQPTEEDIIEYNAEYGYFTDGEDD